MRFSVELVVEVNDIELEKHTYGGLSIVLDFKKNGVDHSPSDDKIQVQAFHFAGQQTQVRLVNLMPGQGNREQPI